MLTAQVWAPAWLRGAGQPWCNSICTSRYSLCDSHERCFCACAGLRACVPSLTQSGRFQRTFTLNLNSTRAVHRHPNSSGTKSSAATSHGLIYILIPCHAYVRRNTCVPRFQVNHVPKGNLVVARVACRKHESPASRSAEYRRRRVLRAVLIETSFAEFFHLFSWHRDKCRNKMEILENLAWDKKK